MSEGTLVPAALGRPLLHVARMVLGMAGLMMVSVAYTAPPEGLVAAADLAGDDRRPQQLLGVVVRGWYFGIVQEQQPLTAVSVDVVVQAIQFRAYRPRQAVEPIVEAILDVLDAAGIACRGQCFTAAG